MHTKFGDPPMIGIWSKVFPTETKCIYIGADPVVKIRLSPGFQKSKTNRKKNEMRKFSRKPGFKKIMIFSKKSK